MFWTKSCPLCNGDLNDNTDIYGNYISRFQCGHYLTLDKGYNLKVQSSVLRDRVLPTRRTDRELTPVAA